MRRLKLAIVFAVAAFAAINPAFATGTCAGSSDDPGGVCDITASVVQVVPPPPGEGTPSVALSNSTQTNYVRYRVTLKHYADRLEAFSQVKFVADTVVDAAGAGAANFVETTPATVANNVGGALNMVATACVIATTHLECTFNFSSPGFDGNAPQATITFDVTVQSPTASAAGSLNLVSKTTYTEPNGHPEPEYFSLTSTSNLTVPDPSVVATYVPTAGTVKTGTNQGAATCTQPWVTIVKVPEAAQVGIDLNPFPDAPPNTQFFSTIGIPDLTDPLGAPKLFGVGTHWYDSGAASRLVVNTLRRDVCTVPGSDAIKRAAHILQEKIYYKPDGVGTQFQQVLLCIVTSGPTPGNPCIAFAQVYTRFNLPRNVANPSDYLGDHEWVIFANENGKYGAP